MELQEIWSSFLTKLSQSELVESCYRKNITGIPFLYVKVNKTDVSAWDDHGFSIISACSKQAMFQKRVTVETNFVRQDATPQFVYRHRFYVPQEKMFCCGNLCPDCIRLRKRT
ncbi:hypothetical protein [Sutcliffiella deserti]|uniref:hypothetical protein n=1 Tax=Sutcliffiella deserti TaxID=2875501 RepID=UPI001CBBB6B0|nr:hypothetical protein [Sutcliffiella deserti]